MKEIFNLIIIGALLLTSCRQATNNVNSNLNSQIDTVAIREIYLIPKNYIGKIEIYFDQTDGSKIEYEDNIRVYRIPESGILKTQFQFNTGTYYKDCRTYYYVDNKDIRKQLLTTANISAKIEGIVIFIDHNIVEKNKEIGERYFVDSLKHLDKYINLKYYKER